mgnify:CR=1 FL=1
MNDIINLEKATEYVVYNPILTLSEDVDYDNCFCVLQTNSGNIAFSYYDLGIAPAYVIQNTILFLSFGKGYYIIDLKEKYVLYKSVDLLSVIFEIIKFDYQSCIVLVGEISLICYSYRNTIFDWFVTDKGLSVVFENDEKWLITLKDGNGIRVE